MGQKIRTNFYDVGITLLLILIGLFLIVIIDKLVFGLLFILGGFVFRFNENIHYLKMISDFLNHFFGSNEPETKKITEKEQPLKMEHSPDGFQQQIKSGRDSYTAAGDLIIDNKQISKREQKAKLSIYYDKDETYHNLPIFNINPVRNGVFLHVMIKNEKKILAKNCYGELIDIRKDENGKYSKIKTFTAPVILKWAHEHFGKKLDIDNDVPRRLDICHTIDGFKYLSFMTERGPRGIQTQFPKGKYKIKVRVKGDNTDFSYGVFLIDYDENWENIKICNFGTT